tara:strand:+ start:1268 stop:2716 length:1449 start_codon:yes stop_codon:yes gene_type:complete
MGSVITNLPGVYDQVDVGGNKKPQMTYIQFVPGVVVSVITALDSENAEGKSHKIGSIRALPHIGGKGVKKKSMIGEEHRYYPLLRGIQEVPVKGDPVLLATFGGRQYYLGPLNTEGNPNFNSDQFEYDELRSGGEKGLYPDEEKITPLFVATNISRLQKPLNPKLDNPQNPDEFISNSIHGDLIFEGRHGNSIRIGSRNSNPNLIISNGRSEDSKVETSLDGTILSITHRGTIRDFFNRDSKRTGKKRGSKEASEKYKFTLADDEVKSTKHRSISKCLDNYLGRGGKDVKDSWPFPRYDVNSNEESFNIEDELYNYNKDQLFASSGRITFNARSDSIYLSALRRIHIGCGSSMTLSTNRNILVEAAESVVTNTGLFKVHADKWVYIDGREKIVLGNPLKNDQTHAAVLGDSLVTLLAVLSTEIKNLALATSEAIENRNATGASVDIMDNTVKAIDQILGKDSNMYPKALADIILSKKVFLKT